MAQNLKNMKYTSVDLVKRGANQMAEIKLCKSAEERKGGEMNMRNETFLHRIGKAARQAFAADHGSEKDVFIFDMFFDLCYALGKSMEGALKDKGLDSDDTKSHMLESLEQFQSELERAVSAWSCGKSYDVKTDPKARDAARKEVLELLGRDSTDTAEALQKELELQNLFVIASQYAILGKKPEELSEKLYELRKSGETFYRDYLTLLDEQLALLGESGVFKEYGSNRGGLASDLNGLVAELMRRNPTLTREQAICSVYEENPNLDPFSGKLK